MAKKADSRAIISIGRIGYAVKHDSRFIIDRPQGSGDCILLHFTTAIRILDCHGFREEPPGACIIYAPPHAQWYCATGDEFNHHWFHFDAIPGMPVLRELKLPLNEIFRVRDDVCITASVQALRLESLRREAYCESAMDAIVRRFLIELSRVYHAPTGRGESRHSSEIAEAFRDVRVRVQEELQTPWRIEDMARLVHLSSSRFSVLYRSIFGVSPVEDLIQARLGKARQLLTNTSLSIGEVANNCGFENQFYFSRLFHKRIGCPPRDYYATRIVCRPISLRGNASIFCVARTPGNIM
jgi:AraC-like DNA-binding protein